MEVDIKADFEAINNQIAQLGQELDKINIKRREIESQILRLQGAAIYLNDKNTSQEEKQEVAEQTENSTEDFERSAEYPSNKES